MILPCRDYLSISRYLVFFTALTQVITALFNGLGKTKIPLKGYLIEMPINAAISYILIYGITGFESYGVIGAAFGSLIAICIRLIYLGLRLYLDTQLSLRLNSDPLTLIRHVHYHFMEIFPVAANMVILAIGATIYQLLYSQLNINSYVAITLIMPWIRSGTQFITSWALSSSILISQTIGSGKLYYLKENISTSIDISIAISVIISVLLTALSLTIDYIYPDLDLKTYQELACIAPLYIILPIIRGYNTAHGHILRSLGKTSLVFKINFIGQWVFSIPLCAISILYFDCSIFWAFAIQPFEEIIKALPFRFLVRKFLNEFDGNLLMPK